MFAAARTTAGRASFCAATKNASRWGGNPSPRHIRNKQATYDPAHARSPEIKPEYVNSLSVNRRTQRVARPRATRGSLQLLVVRMRAAPFAYRFGNNIFLVARCLASLEHRGVLRRNSVLAPVAGQNRKSLTKQPPRALHFTRIVMLQVDPVKFVGASVIQTTMNNAFGHTKTLH